MSRSAATSLSVRPPCHAFWTASKRSTANSARRKPSSPPPPRITAWRGFTRSLDGNGRVARLMSHATLLEALDTGAVWSIARGLARNVDGYKAQLAACDQQGATISTAVVISAKRAWLNSRASS